MQDSDDYFTDDFILDDTALAVLDEEEHKYTLSTQNPTLSRVSPPSKRMKTEAGWRPGPNNRRPENMDDQDDLPEISVQGDGSYGLHARHAAAISSRPSAVGVRINGTQQQSTSSSKHIPTRTASSSSTGPQRRSPGANPRVPERQTSHSTSSPTSIPPVAPSQSSHRTQSAKSTSRRDESDIGTQVRALHHRQMEELRRDNERIRSALEDAVNVRMAKEGEVSVLRKKIEKTAQDHSVQVAKLKAAKEEADIKQAQMQKEVKEEMERLRTQYTFKQHELETSIRKPPWSVRSKRTNTEAPPTPIDIPAQMRGWDTHSETRIAGPSNFVHSTPRRPQFGTLARESPKTIRYRRHMLADSPKKSAKLPGFYNSFTTETPVRSTQVRNAKVKNGDMGDIREDDRKGKGRASVFDQRSQFSSTGPPPPSPPSSPTRGRTVTDIQLHSDDLQVYAGDEGHFIDDNAAMGEVEMMDEDADESMAEELDEIGSPNWQEELHRMILTHTAPSCTAVTFQTLMKAPSETSMPTTSIEVYSKACTRILEVLAATSYCIDWESALYTLAKSLTDMAHLLDAASLISPLSALLNLLTNLSYALPSFSSFLLSPSEEDPDGCSPAKILAILCNVIRNHLAPANATIKSNDSDIINSLATSTIELMESLCWNIPEDLEGQLALIPRSPKVLSILLDAAQPPWLLSRSARLLVLLATRANLFRSLLFYPNSETPDGGEAVKEFTRIPHIERLCSILVDTDLQGTEAQSLRDSILTFFTMLSVAHIDALTILVESLTLIPSLVLYLTHLTTPFREDDLELMASPSTITSSIRAISRTVVLLNYLVFSTEPTFNLRQKLHHAPHRQFNGISYMFIVTFGTLSYGDPPEWVSDKDKIELEKTTEMARDLLDLIVEGPEGDSVYAAYQSDVDEGSVTDDEEMEARLLDANEM